MVYPCSLAVTLITAFRSSICGRKNTFSSVIAESLSKHVDKMDLSNEEDEADSPLQAHEIYVCTQFDYRNHNDVNHTWETYYPCHWKQELKEPQ